MTIDERERRDRFGDLYRANYAAIYADAHRRLAPATSEVSDAVADVSAVAWRRIGDVPDSALLIVAVALVAGGHHRPSIAAAVPPAGVIALRTPDPVGGPQRGLELIRGRGGSRGSVGRASAMSLRVDASVDADAPGVT